MRGDALRWASLHDQLQPTFWGVEDVRCIALAAPMSGDRRPDVAPLPDRFAS